jgi:pimeloyl-ACP methyl ester carboxylesterase
MQQVSSPSAALHRFASNGAAIAYGVAGEGPPVVLAHGLALHSQANWALTGWIDALVAAGRSAIALDLRGHGQSDRPREPSAYGAALHEDVVRLLDHLGIERADFVGYSLGAWVGLGVLAAHPERLGCGVLLGCGMQGLDREHNLFLADVLDGLPCRDPARQGEAELMLRLSDALGNTRQALAALLRSSWAIPLERVRLNTRPVLLISGANDTYAPDPDGMQRSIGSASTQPIPDADHMTTLGHPAARSAALAFLERHGLGG